MERMVIKVYGIVAVGLIFFARLRAEVSILPNVIEHCVTLFKNCITLFINPITLFEYCKTIF